MKTITIHCTWKASIPVEVPDDYEWEGYISTLPEEALEQITASGPSTELVDWY